MKKKENEWKIVWAYGNLKGILLYRYLRILIHTQFSTSCLFLHLFFILSQTISKSICSSSNSSIILYFFAPSCNHWNRFGVEPAFFLSLSLSLLKPLNLCASTPICLIKFEGFSFFLFWLILMALLSILAEILGRPRIVDVFGELMILIAPLWIAVIVGVLVGWTWKPKWANLGREMMDSSVSDDSKSSSTSFSLLGSFPSFNSLNFQMPSCILSSFDGKDEKETSSMPSSSDSDSRLFS